MSFKRTDRIAEEIKKELSKIIRDMKDPRIPVMTSVVTVSITNDLRYAKAYISVMGSDEEKKSAITALTNAEGFIRKNIGAKIKIRCVPEFTFLLDSSIEYGAHINELLKNVIKSDEERE